MALSHSPQIVLDGLVLYLDQFNPKSYPGSGVTLYDLSGNNRHYTLVNGGTYVQNPIDNYTVFSSSKGYAPGYRQSTGIIVDGVDDYIQGLYDSAISNLTEITIELCFGVRNYFTSRQLISTMGNATNLDGFSIRNGGAAGADPIEIQIRKGSTVRTFDFNPNPSGNRTHPLYTQSTENSQYGFNSVTARIWGAGGTVYADISANGSTLSSTQSAALSGITSIYPLWIFKNPTGSTSSAAIFGSGANASSFAYLRVYNRLLSEAEIIQNYSAIRGRYKT
jgi:hypothetical protein